MLRNATKSYLTEQSVRQEHDSSNPAIKINLDGSNITFDERASRVIEPYEAKQTELDDLLVDLPNIAATENSCAVYNTTVSAKKRIAELQRYLKKHLSDYEAAKEGNGGRLKEGR